MGRPNTNVWPKKGEFEGKCAVVRHFTAVNKFMFDPPEGVPTGNGGSGAAPMIRFDVARPYPGYNNARDTWTIENYKDKTGIPKETPVKVLSPLDMSLMTYYDKEPLDHSLSMVDNHCSLHFCLPLRGISPSGPDRRKAESPGHEPNTLNGAR